MNSLPVDLLDEAIAEARSAYRWYLSRSTAAGLGFKDELDAAVQAISDAPERWHRHLHGTRRYLLHRYPYSLIYRIQPGLVLVVAVAHARRRPGYWRRRG